MLIHSFKSKNKENDELHQEELFIIAQLNSATEQYDSIWLVRTSKFQIDVKDQLWEHCGYLL